MIPYYKLPPHWASEHRYFAIIGPEGLVSKSLFSQIINTYKDYQPKYRSIAHKDDLENLKVTLSQSLLPEPEILFIRITDKFAKDLPNTLPSDKIVVLYGLDKAIKHNCYQIRCYHLKEPFKTKAIAKLVSEYQLNISPKAISWLSLSHQHLEHLIPNTLEKIKLTYHKATLSDEEIKPLIYNYNDYPAYEIIDALKDKVSLQLFLSSQRPEDWQAIYWTLLSTWRKLRLSQINPQKLSTYFVWDAQQKSAKQLLNVLSEKTLTAQHQALLDLELDIKGLRQEPFIPKLKAWLLSTQASLT